MKALGKVPANLDTMKPGNLADLLYELKQARKGTDSLSSAYKAEESRIEDYLLQHLTKEELSILAGKVCRVAIVKENYPVFTDWELFYEYLQDTGAFDLMQRRPSAPAFRERWAVGVEIPGTERFTKLSLTVRALPKKGE